MDAISLDDGAAVALPKTLAAIVRDGPPPLTPQELDGIYAVGADLYGRERWSEAEDVFRLLVLVRPTDARGWIALAACHEARGDDDRAVSLYQVASCAPSRVDARLAQLYLARLLAKTGRHDEAREILELITLEDDDDSTFATLYTQLRRCLVDTQPSLHVPRPR
jgi:tetratricopeptide (TPR) repeat protein